MKYKFTITYECDVDEVTGEISNTKIVEKTTPKSTKKQVVIDEDTTPKVIRDDSKLILNSATVALLGATFEDKIEVKYDGEVPIIGTAEAFGCKCGCKLTKSSTVSFRGNKNTELAKYGTEFIVKQHPTKEGLFILTSDKVNENPLKGDENVKIEEDFDLSNLIEDKDANITEIDSSFFQL